MTSKKDLAGNRKRVATKYSDQLNKAFNAGSYHVIAYTADNTVIGEKNFDVKAGERSEGAIPWYNGNNVFLAWGGMC